MTLRHCALFLLLLVCGLSAAFLIQRRKVQMELEHTEQELKRINEWATEVEENPPQASPRIGDAGAGDYPTRKSLSEPENSLRGLDY